MLTDRINHKCMQLFMLLLFACQYISSQGKVFGSVLDSETKLPVEYVNIGIKGKNIGTVSDIHGYYSLHFEQYLIHDSITFSCIGYYTESKSIKNLIAQNDQIIYLTKKTVELNEINVYPLFVEEKVIGNSYNGLFSAGFKDNNKGHECGILIHTDEKALLRKLVCNIKECTYDSVFYRINIYKQTGKYSFENILQQPIMIKENIISNKMQLNIDFSEYDIIIEGNTLITLEHIEDMGSGSLYFYAGWIGSTCYSRHTSQGNWKKTPMKISFSVIIKSQKNTTR
ncbi:hypothetical protein FACS1894181_16840 [Bacteroidia bacterium]|nr:hypothetical protein FACS1894181_16840 [Bacteroidia bacterium]